MAEEYKRLTALTRKNLKALGDFAKAQSADTSHIQWDDLANICDDIGKQLRRRKHPVSGKIVIVID